jgi:hypothetical protein
MGHLLETLIELFPSLCCLAGAERSLRSGRRPYASVLWFMKAQ